LDTKSYGLLPLGFYIFEQTNVMFISRKKLKRAVQIPKEYTNKAADIHHPASAQD
jgi:hypothetical protein